MVVTPAPGDREPLSIAEVAAAFDVPVSTLRYYDNIDLVPASHRRGRVRHYGRADLRRLAYVRLWHADGALSIDRTQAILGSADRSARNEMIERSQQDLSELIARLSEAREMLGHLTGCRYDDHTSCPIVRGYLEERVETTLAGGQYSPVGESIHAAMHRVKAGLGADGHEVRREVAERDVDGPSPPAAPQDATWSNPTG